MRDCHCGNLEGVCYVNTTDSNCCYFEGLYWLASCYSDNQQVRHGYYKASVVD